MVRCRSLVGEKKKDLRKPKKKQKIKKKRKKKRIARLQTNRIGALTNEDAVKERINIKIK